MKAQEFLDAVAVASGLDRTEADRTIAVVLSTLRQRLTPETCDHLVSRLPPSIGRYLEKSGKRLRTKKLSREELEQLAGEALPEKAAMSLINANVAAPINAALALNVLSDNSVAYANAEQNADITQSN